jgi:hypothetical protein
MLLNTDYAQPAELTGYTREALANLPRNQFALRRWLPDDTIDDLIYRFSRGGEGLTEAATYRSYDAEAPIGSRPGVTRVTGELPPISRKIRLGEYERLLQRRLDEAIGDQIFSDATRMMRAIAARIELARGEALSNGSLVFNENGVVATLDFGRAAGHTVTAGTVWSNPAATILSDLLSWRSTYVTTNDGLAPGAIVTSETVIAAMLRNTELRTLLATTAGTPSIVSRDNLNQVLAAHGLPPIFEYNAQVRVNGTAQRVIPSDRVLLLPAGSEADDGTVLGTSLWGTTAEALSSDYAIEESEAPGIVAGAYETKDPVALWTKASAIAVPILANPNLSFSADVL